MAERRMFSKSVIDTDQFIEMPVSARLLYFDLGMRADDDGFITPKRVMKMTGATEDDLRILITRKYVIPFESGVIVIRHWRMNNYLKNDRYKETEYKTEKDCLELVENKYEPKTGTLLDTECLQSGYTGKDRIEIELELGKDNTSKINKGDSKEGNEKCSKNPISSALLKKYEGVFVDFRNAEAIMGWIESRKKTNKKPPTDRAIELAIKKAIEFNNATPQHSIADYFDNATLNGWQGIFQFNDEQKNSALRKNIKAAPDYDPSQEINVTKYSFDGEDS